MTSELRNRHGQITSVCYNVIITNTREKGEIDVSKD